jgi:hypothetical protein
MMLQTVAATGPPSRDGPSVRGEPADHSGGLLGALLGTLGAALVSYPGYFGQPPC